MKIRFFVLYLLVLLLLLPACSTAPDSSSNQNEMDIEESTTEDSQDDPGLNLLFIGSGQANLKRRGWSDYYPTTFGVNVAPGDQIYPAAESEIFVLCANLDRWDVPAGMPSGLSNGCDTESEPVLVRESGNIGTTRGGDQSYNIPYIINPRGSRLMDTTPLLQWHTVSDTSSYHVRIQGGDIDWEVDVSGSSLEYPGDVPLSPGETYLLVVEADNGRSSLEENVPGLGFSILPPVEAVELESSLSSLEVLDLPPEAEEFVLAQVLIRHQLLAEAQQVLLELAEQPGLRPAVNQTLGDVYLQTGLYYYAEDQFLQAADMFTSLGDVEGQALAYSKLGETYRMLGNNALAIDSFKEAEARLEILGDEASIKAVQEKLAELTP